MSCQFCQIFTCPSRIRQTSGLPNQSQQNAVADLTGPLVVFLTHKVHDVACAIEGVEEPVRAVPRQPRRRGAAVPRGERVGRRWRQGGEEPGRAPPVLPRDQVTEDRLRGLGRPEHHTVHLGATAGTIFENEPLVDSQ